MRNIRELFLFVSMIYIIAFNSDSFIELMPSVRAKEDPWPPVCPNEGHPENTCSV